MNTPRIENGNQTLGFLSMTIAWTLMNVLHSLYLAWTYGEAQDSGVVIFWSGLFITIAWAVFIVFPLNRLDHNRPIFKPHVFPLIAGVYGALTYSIIVGGLFRSFDLVMMCMPLAILTGLIFGFSYSLLIRSHKLNRLLSKRPFIKIIFILSPAIILSIFLWLLPTVAPSLVFPYMPDEIRDKIVSRTIPKYKVGDDFEALKNALPGYLDHVHNGSGNMAATTGNFAFVLQVHCNKIIRIEYARDRELDMTIYSKLQEQPCP